MDFRDQLIQEQTKGEKKAKRPPSVAKSTTSTKKNKVIRENSQSQLQIKNRRNSATKSSKES